MLADRDQLYRVLMNLGRNAAEALPQAGGLISITAWQTTRRDGDRDGRYRPRHCRRRTQAHLFEAFSGSARPGGTGLGLAIAREIMRAHGGDVVLAHTGDEGTAFRLTLPLR